MRVALGLIIFCLLAWALSRHRGRFPWRVVVMGLLLQFVLGALMLRTAAGREAFDSAARFVQKLISMAQPGGEMVFGVLADPVAMDEVFGPGRGFILGFAGQGLVVIIFFSALMALLYHLGVMQVITWLMAKVMSRLMGLSGSESVGMAAEVFVGQTESPLAVRPYLAGMTLSELNSMMVGGFATVAGSVMAVYMGMVGPQYAPHLLTASVLSAPAAFVIAKILVPETQPSETAGRVELRIERDAQNALEAVANGTTDGLKLWLNVIAMLISFVALVALVDWPLGALGDWWGIEGGLSLRRILGLLFAPLAWAAGVEGWHDCQVFGSLLGTKMAINEFVAYAQLQDLLPVAAQAEGFLSTRSATMCTYALCGFANFASIGIQIGGYSALIPERKKDLARLGLRAMLGGTLATLMTATVAGAFL